MRRLLEEFKEYLKEMNQYDHVTGLLQWDMQTTVPKLGQAAHVDALTYFSTKSFEMGTSEKLGEFLEKLAQPAEYDALDDTWRFIVKRMKRDYDRNKRIPADLYEAFVRQGIAPVWHAFVGQRRNPEMHGKKQKMHRTFPFMHRTSGI